MAHAAYTIASALVQGNSLHGAKRDRLLKLMDAHEQTPLSKKEFVQHMLQIVPQKMLADVAKNLNRQVDTHKRRHGSDEAAAEPHGSLG